MRSGALVTLASVDERETVGRSALARATLPRRAMPGAGEAGRDPAASLEGDSERGTVTGEDEREGMARGMADGLGDSERAGRRSTVLDLKSELASLLSASSARRIAVSREVGLSTTGAETDTAAGVMPATVDVTPETAEAPVVALRMTRGRPSDLGATLSWLDR